MSKPLFVFAIVAVGCGARVEATGNGTPDAALDARVEVAWDVGPEPLPKVFCPDEEPREDSKCALGTGQYSLDCSYGDSPEPECRTWLTCVSIPDAPFPQWRRRSTPCTRGTTPCPTTQPEPDSACARDGPSCVYPDGTLCWCLVRGVEEQWSCVVPEPTCPTLVPNDGTRCSSPMECLYGERRGCISPGVSATCSDGHWTWMGACSDK